MTRRLPPLNQLRAFEAAARHLSFKDAADELHVTHAAVSHQIKALEEFLGSKLFHRGSRGVTLTAEAEELARDLTQAMDVMDGAVRLYSEKTSPGHVTISTVPWYANRILLPALDAFHDANPGIKIKFDFSYGTVDLEKSDIDAALRHGNGKWQGLVAEQVHRDLLSPCSAPSLVEGVGLPIDMKQLAKLPLAVAKGYESAWYQFFSEAGWTPPPNLNFIEFENRALATEFAIAGHGVALPDIISTNDEFRSGKLLLLSDVCLSPETGAFLVSSESRASDAKMKIIAEWLRGLFAALPVPEPCFTRFAP